MQASARSVDRTRPFVARALPVVALAAALLPLRPASAGSADSSASIPPDSPARAALERANRSAQQIVEISEDQRSFDNTLGAVDDLLARLELDTNMMMFMAYVSADAAERERGQRAEVDVTNWLIDLAKREDLYDAVREYADTNPRLAGEQARLLQHALRDYRRAGMDLAPADRARLTEVQKEISRLGIEFDGNIRDDETRVPLTRAELVGLPDDYFAGIKRVDDVYLVGMSYPEFLPIMDYADDETTRKKVWLAYKRRGGMKNVRLLERMLALRAEAASILGYDSAADYEIEVKMAKRADAVMAFYEKLRPLVREKSRRDFEEFLAAKRGHTGDQEARLYPWDYSYYLHRLRKDKYAVDSERVREYFPLASVVDGLFGITQALYGLEYRNVTDVARSAGRPFWHEDVELYEVWDRARNERLGEFYLDLHPRDNKYGHAAQWGLAQHKVWTNGDTTEPVAALVCNFTKPTDDKPSLMTHDEVETFFHEFGHCLHTILSESRYWQFGGTNVERDFVEAPSQMFENWVWDADVLRMFARHYETGEPFPADLLDGMLRARYLGSGLAAERQFFYGLYDMKCHLAPGGEVDTMQLTHDLWGDYGDGVELYAAVPETFFQAAFGHLTGYQAGYYGYQWSLVYACDMFQRFRELGMLDPEAGKYYRERILSRGGTQDGLDLVTGYLEREPDMEAYLKHLGLDLD